MYFDTFPILNIENTGHISFKPADIANKFGEELKVQGS